MQTAPANPSPTHTPAPQTLSGPRIPFTRSPAPPKTSLRRVFRDGSAPDIEAMAEFLTPADRALVLNYLRRNSPTRELAALAGVSEKSIRTRLRALVLRMNSPTFRLVAANLAKWPKPRREAARALFLHGLPLKFAALKLNISVLRVMEHRAATLALLESDPQRSLPSAAMPGPGLHILPRPQTALHAQPQTPS